MSENTTDDTADTATHDSFNAIECMQILLVVLYRTDDMDSWLEPVFCVNNVARQVEPLRTTCRYQ